MGSAGESPIRFGFVTPYFQGLDWARHCEVSGADLITCGEGPTVFDDPTLSLALYAEATTRVRLGPSVTAPGLPHPAVLANTYSTLQKLSGGRAYLGIGTGDLSLIQIGERPYRLDAFLEYALAVRGLCAGEEVTYGGKPLKLEWTAGPVPLWFGADAPRALGLAGQHADGVIVGQAFHPDIVEHVRQHVGAGAAAAGRSLDDDIEIWYVLRALVTDEEHGAIRIDGLDEYAARQTFFLWRMAGKPERSELAAELARRKGLTIDDDVAERLSGFTADYDEALAFNSKHNVHLLERYGLTDWAGRLFYKSGPLEQVVAQVGELVAAGATNFLVPFMVGDTTKGVDQTAELFTALRASRAAA